MSDRHKIVRIIARMNVGGPARQVIELSRGLANRGFETVVATGEPAGWEGDLRSQAEAAGVRVVTVPGLAAPVRSLRDLQALAGLTKLLRRERPSLVHTHTAKAGVLGRLAAQAAGVAARVHTFHGTVFEGYFSPARSRWIVRVERTLARRTQRIVAVSHAVADELEQAGIDPAILRVIEPVVDLSGYLSTPRRKGALRRELGIATDEVLLGWVGRLVPIKRPQMLLDAAAILVASHPKARFVIVGAGPLEGELRATLESSSLRGKVHMLGFRSDMASVYSDLDWIVSTSAKEGMPVALLEAAAAGVPAVATPVGGTPELVADERSGVLTLATTGADLARTLQRVLELPADQVRTMSGVARVRAREKFGLERGLSRHAQMYSEVLESP